MDRKLSFVLVRIQALTRITPRHFFIPSACSIKIYSASTLKVVSTLSPISTSIYAGPSSSTRLGHDQVVTALALNPQNPLQLYSASLDGTIKLWDWLEGTLLRTVEFGQPIWDMCAHADFPEQVFVHADVSQTPQRLVTRDEGNGLYI